MRLRSWQLFAVCVLVWGTTWHAITWQLGAGAAEVAVALRFAVAGLVMLGIAAARGEPLVPPAGTRGLLVLQGLFMYGVSYVCVYHAEHHVPSGLVAVGYSASPLVTGLGARLVFGERHGARFVAGGLLGVAGVALIFWPEFARVDAGGGRSPALGAGFTVAAVLLSAVGALAASRNARHGLPFWSAIGWGMLLGATTAASVALALGRSFALPAALPWWIALAWLALAGSALAFASFLALQQRVGPGRAATVGIAVPVLALVVSMLVEGYRPTLVAALGTAIAVAGNVLMLRAPKRRGGEMAQPARAHDPARTCPE